LAEGQTGRCRVRGVRHGELQALAYGCISGLHLDPIEKKPLYHFYPGRSILSVGGWGCNFGCEFCQNWQISQAFEKDGLVRTPESVVGAAVGEPGNVGLAYTYNEPIVGVEFVLDCAKAIRGAGLRNVLVTNGFIQPKPASELLPLTDALNVDIKSMDEMFYRRYCKGQLAPVLAFCQMAVEAGCHLEITHLTIPGMNDTEANMEQLASWIAGTLGARTPLHLSAYFPRYRFSIEETAPDLILRLREVALRHLPYVYAGNLHSRDGGDTCCPQCGGVLIRRYGYRADVRGIRNGQCASCGRAVDAKGV
jgi:pyruvate formate lyase activating enzyme